ncbi:hypothetical protein VKT23_009431 [Stygiomarasmius scandens]
MSHCTPNALVPVVQAEFPNITAAQIYTAWIKLSEELWKRADNQLESAKQLLEELGDEVEVMHTVNPDGVEQLCWVMKKIAGPLGQGTVEVGLDATYKTNSKHLELYCVMAEHDNAGFPLSYCLLSTATSMEQRKRTKALCKWVTQLRDQWGVNPEFVNIDKDMAEIGMVRKVWPTAKIQLCWWHLRRAVRERLAKAKLSTTPYNPIRARLEFTFIDPDFRPVGSPDLQEYEGGFDFHQPVQAPKGPSPNSIFLRIPATQLTLTNSSGSDEDDDEYDFMPPKRDFGPTELVLPDGRKLRIIPPKPSNEPSAESESEAEDDTVQERRTFCPSEYRATIQEMMDNHLHAHPLIPGYAAPTQQGIREWAVKQMYRHCEKNDLREVWAYLWENWYRPGRWELWARSVSDKIPRLKTTMILESQ